MPSRTLHLLPTFHHDIAYLQRCDEYLPDCEKIIDEALRILAAEPDYTFMIEQIFLIDWYWEKRPDQRGALKRFYDEGRLTIAPGMWTVPDLNLPDGESLLQQIRIGKAWIAKNLGGVREEPRVCWIADCWGHPPQMPQLARASGYFGYVFWRCMRPEVQQADFVWRGLDGSEVAARWMARGYANLRFPTEAAAVNAAELRFANTNAGSLAELVEQLDSYSARGAEADQLICNGGDMAFPQASGPAVARRLRAEGLPVRFSSLEAFFAARDAAAGQGREGGELPVVEGEFNSALTGTFTSNIRLKLANRACTERLLALEKLAALRGLGRAEGEGGGAVHSVDFDPLWKLLLKQQFHDTICGTLGDGALQDAFEEFAELERGLASMESRIGGMDAGVPAGGGGVVGGWFNACSFARTAWLDGEAAWPALLELPAHGEVPASAAKLLAGETGGGLPPEFVTPHYRARFDERGYITSLVEAKSGAECVRSQPVPFGAIAMVPDYGDLWLNHEGPLNGGGFESSLTQNKPDPLARGSREDIVNHGPFWPAITEVRVLFYGPEALVFEQRGRIGFWRQSVEFVTTVRLCAALPRIEYRTRLTPRGRDFRLRAVFGTPFGIGSKKSEARFEVPFGVVARGTGEHAAQRFVDLREAGDNGAAGAGLAVLNRGTAGHAVEDGAILMSLFRAVGMDYKAPSELSYAEGVEHVFDYAVQPHAGPATAELVRSGAEFNAPLLPLAAAQPGRESFYADPDAGVDDPVLVSSIRSAPEGLAVRLAETRGGAAEVVLRLPSGITRQAEADALGRRTGEWRMFDAGNTGAWRMRVRAWEVRAVLFG
ncbi:alpha-mannosidase [Opitutaceae bacterium TAV4]|nr:alpha-mannosidase [Opitutaceae bacterium TAV4]